MQNLQRQYSYARKASANEEIVSSSKEEDEDENQEDDAINTEECNKEAVAVMLVLPSPEYNKKTWKSLNDIFDKRRRDSVAVETNIGIEDIDMENIEEEGVTANDRKKKVKFTSEQYISLAKSWMCISQDSISGNNMKGQKFWEKVVHFCNTLESLKRT